LKDLPPGEPAFFLQSCLQIEERLVEAIRSEAEELLDIRLKRVETGA
jgi:hypothetical protein